MAEYTLDEARAFAENLDAQKDIQGVDIIYLGKALKTLGKSNEERAFRRIVDSYSKLCESQGTPEMKNDPLGFIEFLCAAMDHGFSRIGYKGLMANAEVAPTMPLLETQQLFRELYGTHFR